jgi:hypothetical protein
MTVGNVYPDPRGKVQRDGQREHIFNVRHAEFVTVMRYPTRTDAERAREQILKHPEVTR